MYIGQNTDVIVVVPEMLLPAHFRICGTVAADALFFQYTYISIQHSEC